MSVCAFLKSRISFTAISLIQQFLSDLYCVVPLLIRFLYEIQAFYVLSSFSFPSAQAVNEIFQVCSPRFLLFFSRLLNHLLTDAIVAVVPWFTLTCSVDVSFSWINLFSYFITLTLFGSVSNGHSKFAAVGPR